MCILSTNLQADLWSFCPVTKNKWSSFIFINNYEIKIGYKCNFTIFMYMHWLFNVIKKHHIWAVHLMWCNNPLQTILFCVQLITFNFKQIYLLLNIPGGQLSLHSVIVLQSTLLQYSGEGPGLHWYVWYVSKRRTSQNGCTVINGCSHIRTTGFLPAVWAVIHTV